MVLAVSVLLPLLVALCVCVLRDLCLAMIAYVCGLRLCVLCWFVLSRDLSGDHVGHGFGSGGSVHVLIDVCDGFQKGQGFNFE